MAKALAAIGHEVTVYHLIPDLNEEKETIQKGQIQTIYLKCKHLGKHAFVDMDKLDKDIVCYITASDNYLLLGRFYRWCKKNQIHMPSLILVWCTVTITVHGRENLWISFAIM